MKRIFTSILLLSLGFLTAHSQSFNNNSAKTIHGGNSDLYDTISVAGLNQSQLNGNFGLNNLKLKITYPRTGDLEISLIAPDGTTLLLAADLGGNSANYNNTTFTMETNTLINMGNPPFNNSYRPESWLGNVNNGQTGNGNWVLHIHNRVSNNTTGTLNSWELNFNTNPAPPAIFQQSNLPIVVVNTQNQVINYVTKSEVDATMGIINNGTQTNHLTDAFNEYDGNITIKVRGSSSAGFPQHSYTVTTQNAANDDDTDVTILGMAKGSKWVLYGAWDDKSLIRNVLTYNLSNQMGDYAVRTRFCELVINGDYKGVYVFMEKIKRGTGRVEIEKLSANTTSGEDLTGGYIFQVDRAGTPGVDSWYSNYRACFNTKIPFVYEYPGEDKINTAQKNYLASYVDSFESALHDGNLYDTVNGYRNFIDVPSFIDQSILQELGHNIDGYRLSTFLHKAKNEKLKGGPIWDFNLAYGNADYYNGSATNNFAWDFDCMTLDANPVPFWWEKLFSDTSFLAEYKCRYSSLRQTTLSDAHLQGMIDSLQNLLAVPQSRNFVRWPILGVYLWPNNFVGNTWEEELSYLENWLGQRTSWMDGQLHDAVCAGGVGIDNVDKVQNLVEVFPNPSSGNINVRAHQENIRQIEVFGMLGRKVLNVNLDQKQYQVNLKTAQLQAGIYQMMITTETGRYSRKVVLLP